VFYKGRQLFLDDGMPPTPTALPDDLPLFHKPPERREKLSLRTAPDRARTGSSGTSTGGGGSCGGEGCYGQLHRFVVVADFLGEAEDLIQHSAVAADDLRDVLDLRCLTQQLVVRRLLVVPGGERVGVLTEGCSKAGSPDKPINPNKKPVVLDETDRLAGLDVYGSRGRAVHRLQGSLVGHCLALELSLESLKLGFQVVSLFDDLRLNLAKLTNPGATSRRVRLLRARTTAAEHPWQGEIPESFARAS